MKQFLNAFLSLAILALSVNLVVTACSKGGEKSVFNLEAVLEKLNAGKLPHEQSKLIYSDVVLQQVAKDEYGIFVLEDNVENATGKFFILQSEKLEREKNAILRDAKILWMNNSVAIEHSEGAHFFYVGSKNELFADVAIEHNLQGFGVSKHQNKTYWQEVISMVNRNKAYERTSGASDPLPDGPLPEEPEEKVNCKCVSTIQHLECESGGEGSTSCSVSQTVTAGPVSTTNTCTTTCGTGYYACCNK
jgi:hypothetical protein